MSDVEKQAVHPLADLASMALDTAIPDRPAKAKPTIVRKDTAIDDSLAKISKAAEAKAARLADETGAYSHSRHRSVRLPAPTVSYRLAIPDYLHEDLSALAAARGVTVRHVILSAIAQHESLFLDALDNPENGNKIGRGQR